MSTIRASYSNTAPAGKAIERDARELLGQVMGFVAVAAGFAALGAYLGRNLTGATGLVLFIGAFAARSDEVGDCHADEGAGDGVEHGDHMGVV